MGGITDWTLSLLNGRIDLTAVLLDVAIKGSVLLIMTWGLALALRRASAALRHLVWSLALVGLLALPVLSLVVPQWTVPGLPRLTVPALEFTALTVPADVAPREASRAVVPHAPRVDASSLSRRRVTARAGTAGAPAGERVSSAPPPPAAVASTDAAGIQPQAADQRQDVGYGPGLGWKTWLSVLWIVGAVLVASIIVIGIVRTWWLGRAARVVSTGPLSWLLHELSGELDIARPVILLQSDGPAMPMAWGVRARVMLPADADDWTDARLRAVLLHELAHVKRQDYLTQLLGRFASALHWFNPLVWVAVRRMRMERELACDDRVLSTGSRASDYAAHLLEIARSMRVGALTSVVSVAMARRSRLSDRVLAVLDPTRRRAILTQRMALTAWVGAACVVVPMAGAVAAPERAVVAAVVADSSGAHAAATREVVPPVTRAGHTVPRSSPEETLDRDAKRVVPLGRTVEQRCDWYAREGRGRTSTSMHVDDDDVQIRITVGDCRLDIEAVGEIVFNEAETDLVSISRGGYFEIEEREGRARRRVEIEPQSDGSLSRKWFVNGDERAFDEEARTWLSDFLPLLFRRAGYQAEERAARILARQGVEGVLSEISLIPSDYTARIYYQVLLTQGNLDEAQIRQVVRQAGEQIGSDYELAQLLVEIANSHPVDEAVMAAYMEAAGTIGSDYEQRRVLDAILGRQGLSRDVTEAMLELASEIDSDYELAQLLIDLLDKHPIDRTLIPAFFEAVNTLGSDYEQRRVLQAVLAKGAPSQEVLDLSLESAVEIDSDYERAELLIDVAGLYPVDQTIPASYLAAAESISSDFELGRVLKALVGRGRLSETALTEVLEASATVGSDYELAGILIDVVGAYDLDDANGAAFFRAVRSLDSDYEHSRVLQQILARKPLTEETVSAVIGSSLDISSDYELATVLVKTANSFTINDRLRPEFLRAADTISSTYERGRALSALMPRGNPR